MLVTATVLTVTRGPCCWSASPTCTSAGSPPGKPRLAPSGRYTPGVSVVVPAYNEAADIAATVRSLVRQRLPGRSRSSSSTTAPPTAPRRSRRGLSLPGVRRDPPGQRRQAGRAQHRHRPGPRRPPRAGRRRHRLRARHARPAGAPFADPTSARSAATPRWPTGAGCSAGGSTSSTSSASTSTGGCTTCSARCPPCPARSARSGGRRSPRSAASATTPWPRTPTSRWPSAGPAGGSSTRRRPRLDRGAGDPAAAVAAALPVVLRHHAGDVEAPAGGGRARAGRPVRPARPGLPRPLPDPAAAVRAGRGRLRRVRADLPHPVKVAAFWLASPPCRSLAAGYALRLDRRAAAGHCGHCRCSSSCTGS